MMLVRRATILKFVVFIAIAGITVAYIAAKRAEVRLSGGPSGRAGSVDAPGPVEAPALEPKRIDVTDALPVEAVAGKAQGNFFESYRLERGRARSQQAEWLKEIINNQNTAPEIKQQANRELLELTRRIGLETDAEGLIKAKGYLDALVFLFDGSATVILKAPKVGQADIARIGDIVTRVAKIPVEKVSIIAREG